MYTLMITAGGTFCSLYASESERTVIKIRDRLIDTIHLSLKDDNVRDIKDTPIIIYNNFITTLNTNYNIDLDIYQRQSLLNCLKIIFADQSQPFFEKAFKVYTTISTISVVNEEGD